MKILMTCYHPIPCAKGVEVATGKIGVYFSPSPPKGVRYIEGLTVPCGKCIGCRLDHSRQWATRCVHEAKMHKENAFLTLTYNEEHLPGTGTLVMRDMQLFWKRLRKEIAPIKVRYFQCGEYGTLLNRPHYHAILFGYDFKDKYLFSTNHGHPIFRSPMLERLWSDKDGIPIGYCSIGDVTFESCAYVARYCLKKIGGDKAAEHYHGRKPEFVVMSRRPGIGHDWLTRYLTDVYPADKCLARQGTNGEILPLRPPKYYDAIYDTIDPDGMEAIKARRKDFAKSQHNSSDEKRRLSAQEYLKTEQGSRLIRPFEVIKDNHHECK